MPKIIDIYTDGACSGNPGPGGYAAVLLYKQARREISGGVRWTTNNRMELIALIEAIAALKEPCEANIHTDSNYLVGAFDKGWLETWKRKGWRTSKRTDVQNRDLWERLEELLADHEANFKWVKGHSDVTENNRCDELAVAAAQNHGGRIDEGYERTNPFPKIEEG